MSYLQLRVTDLIGTLALKKAAKDKLLPKPALFATREWIKEQLGFDVSDVESLSDDECKAVVGLLHKKNLVEKN